MHHDVVASKAIIYAVVLISGSDSILKTARCEKNRLPYAWFAPGL
jgi:hypothetical protein